MKATGSEIIASSTGNPTKTLMPLGETGREIQSNSKPETVQEWQGQRLKTKSQIEQLDMQSVKLRSARLVAMLEVASYKIDRFGWGQMNESLKQEICDDWCDVLSKYRIDEVKAGISDYFSRTGGNARSINEHHVEAEIKRAHAKAVSRLSNVNTEDVKPLQVTQEELAHRRSVVADTLGEAMLLPVDGK